jgi:SPX domain protein involved in polyphosphate accumulation
MLTAEDNIDYNSLKHEIKIYTSRDQATAIAIPGQQDTALNKFEGRLYQELCSQHDRVDLFVSSKADEISRRLGALFSQSRTREQPIDLRSVLEYLSDQIQRLIIKCAEDGGRVPLKRQRKLAKYEREVLRCGEDVNALSRFINAQVIAFRKITKKYKVRFGRLLLSLAVLTQTCAEMDWIVGARQPV